jgi:hypothetical protein
MQVSEVVAEALGLLGPRKQDGIHSRENMSLPGFAQPRQTPGVLTGL